MIKTLYFLAGGISGVIIGYMVTKRYYETEMETALAKQREYYTKGDEEEKDSCPDVEQEAKEAMERYSGGDIPVKEPRNYIPGPRVITYEDLDTEPTYEKVYMTWYAEDGVLVKNEIDLDEEETDIIVDVYGTVGDEFRDCFGEEYSSVVYVRNDSVSKDYIITKEDTPYDYEE